MADHAKEDQPAPDVDELEYRVPAPMFAQMVALIAELPGKHSWQILAAASQLRPEKKG